MTKEQIKRLAKVSGEYVSITECMDEIIIFVNDIYDLEMPKAFPKLIKILNDTCISKDEEIDIYYYNDFEVNVMYFSTDI